MHMCRIHCTLNHTDVSALVCVSARAALALVFFSEVFTRIDRVNYFNHSERKLSTGFINDALIEWKLKVVKVINRIAVNGAINIHHSRFILKAKLSNHLVIVK